MPKLKFAVVGVGHLGSIHAKLLAENTNIELVGIRDIIPERASKIAEQYQCIAFESLEQTISEVDAAIIAVPTSIHWQIAQQFIESNKHCFIEKPITELYSESVQLINLASKKNIIVQVGHVERFNPVIKAISHYHLNPLFIEAHRLGQFKPRAKDVSVIHDLMIHDIDLILWLAKSEVENIDANGVSVLSDSVDIANARIKFKSGLTANITASRISAHPMRKMRIFQKDAYLSLDFQEHNLEVYKIYDDNVNPTEAVPAIMLGSIETGVKNRNIYFEKPKIENINAIAEEQNHFISSIINKTPIAVTAVEASEALQVAEEIIKLVNN